MKPESKPGAGHVELDDAFSAMALSLSARNLANMAFHAGDLRAATFVARCSVVLARRSADEATLAEALLMLSRSEWGLADRAGQAYTHAHEALLRAPIKSNTALHCEALQNCAMIAGELGDLGTAAPMCLRIVQILRRQNGVPAHRAIAQALISLGFCLERMGVHEEAAAAYRESIVNSGKLPGPGASAILARTNLAHCLIGHGREREAVGDFDTARDLLDEAHDALPLLDLAAWRSFSRSEIWSLSIRVAVQSELGLKVDARCTAAVYLRYARSKRIPSNFFYAFYAVSQLYEHEGQAERAIRYGQRVIALREGRVDSVWNIDCLQRLGRLHAVRGELAQALGYQKQLSALRSRRSLEVTALRCRLAASERRIERRQRVAQESLNHARRLSVIGRLIAQTHHALSAPIDSVHALCTRALELLNDDTGGQTVAPVLEQIAERIDRAAALTQQLKLYSFRSAPQPMELSLFRAIEQARDDLAPHLPADVEAVALQVSGDAHVEVWADPQRLGILLKVLFIEMLGHAGRKAERADAGTVFVHVERAQLRMVVVSIDALGATSVEARPGLGAALCIEIAGEMNGELVDQHGDDGLIRFRLALPEALSPIELARE